MKKLLLTIVASAFMFTGVWANDVADDGKCLDDIQHYNHLVKTTSASDEDKAAAIEKRNEGSNYWASGDKEKCETAYQAAWALID